MRVDNWTARLNAAIEAARGRPFSWGAHDCALFAADVVMMLTGIDYGAAFRGRYASARGAATVIAQAGGLEAIATRALGDPVDPVLAQRGDVALIKAAGVAAQPSLGICVGDRIAVPGLLGLVFLPRGDAVKAWKV